MTKNLKRGQYQIGELVFGRNTMFPVETREINGYEINDQSYQLDQSDENRFGLDSKKPAPITLTMGYLMNGPIDNILGFAGDPEMDFSQDPALGDLTAEWEADALFKSWGELKPLYYCRRDGQVLMIFGRPGRISYRAPNFKANFIRITAEYRRADIKCYSEEEYFTVVESANTPETVYRGNGNTDTWFRIWLRGPMVNPVINWGPQQITLNHTIPADTVVEISTYPWARRIVDSNGLSLASKLTGPDPYLDRLKFRAGEFRQISWNASGIIGGTSQLVFLHREAWNTLD